MTTSVRTAETHARKVLTPLRTTVIVALIANVLAQLVLQVAIVRSLIPPLAVIMVLTLVVAALCATRWRWAPLLAAVWCVVSVLAGFEPYTFNLLHPGDVALFIQTLVALALYGIAAVAATGAFVQERRPTPATARPAWLVPFVVGVITFVVGASLVAPAAASVAPELDPVMLAQLPAIVATANRFEQSELRVRAGQLVAFRLDNNDGGHHSFDIDELNVHAPMPINSPGIAIFTPQTGGRYTFYCAIPGHTEAGMVGTLIVEP